MFNALSRQFQHWLRYIELQLDVSHGRHNTIKPMEGIRGVGAMVIFWVHFSSQFSAYIDPNTITGMIQPYLYLAGNIGVDLFFMVSGYLIYGVLVKRRDIDWLRYFKRRFMRIYPTFAVVFVIYLVLNLALPSHSKLPEDNVDALILVVQNLLLLPGVFDIVAINTVTWTLSYEVCFYVFVPLIVGFTGMRDWSVKQRIVFWSVFTVILCVVMPLFDGPIRIIMFLAGALLFEIYHHFDIKIPPWTGTFCLLVGFILWGVKREFGISLAYLAPIVLVLCLILSLEFLTQPDRATARWLGIKIFRYFGNMSYSYYLLHSLVLKAMMIVCVAIYPPEQQFSGFYWFAIFPAFLVTFVVGFVLFILVERPVSLELPKVSIKDKSPSTNS